MCRIVDHRGGRRRAGLQAANEACHGILGGFPNLSSGIKVSSPAYRPRLANDPKNVAVSARPKVGEAAASARAASSDAGRTRRDAFPAGKSCVMIEIVRRQIALVAAEQLVAAIAGKHDRHVATRHLRNGHRRQQREIDDRLVVMLDDVGHEGQQVAGRHLLQRVFDPQVLRPLGERLSSNSELVNPIVNVRTRSWATSRIRATTRLESVPPDRNAPSGTSETSRLRTRPRHAIVEMVEQLRFAAEFGRLAAGNLRQVRISRITLDAFSSDDQVVPGRTLYVSASKLRGACR